MREVSEIDSPQARTPVSISWKKGVASEVIDLLNVQRDNGKR
jgi:hypothetical protein